MSALDPFMARITNPQLLLVEDEPIHAQNLTEAVASLEPPWDVIHCTTGSDALDHIEKPSHAFELAIVDLGLPDIGGLDIVRAWRKQFVHQPLLVVSAITAERTLLEAIRAGANGYLLKDGNVQAMAHCIEQVLQGHNPISPAIARYLFKLAGAPRSSAQSQIELTAKEKETLHHIGRGHSYSETATHMGVSLSTVQTHVRSLYRKLGAHSQMQAVIKAKEHGLI